MAFGDSGVLDNFNRADAGSLGANWSNAIYGGSIVLGVSSNVAYGDGSYDDAWWNADSFAADQEAFVTVPALPADGGGAYVFVRLATPGSGTVDGYYLIINRSGSAYTWTIYRTDNGSDTALSGSGSSQSLAAGDSFGLRAVGSTLSAWHRPSGGSWSQLFTRTDSTYSAGGYVGMGTIDATVRLDDFGGGNINDATGEIDQEGFRWRNDNGSETTATWAEAQDTDISAEAEVTRRLRVLLDATGDPDSSQFRLETRAAGGTFQALGASAITTPSVRSVGTLAAGTGNITVAWPTHEAGDIGLLIVESTGGEAANLGTANGFAAVADSPVSTGTTTNGTRLTVYWARATSSSMASPVVTDPGNHAAGLIIVIRDCIDSGDPWEATATDTKAAASTSASAPSVTTTYDNSLIVNVIARDNDSASAAFSAWTNSSLTSLTEQYDAGTTQGNGGGFGIATGTLAAAGASGTTTATVTSSINVSFTMALLGRRNPFTLQASANITAGGEATTAQLAAPSGKSTSDFVAGRIQDDENPADAVDITADDYTELEWCIRPTAYAVNATVYEFRVTVAGAALDTYSVTPTWTITSVQTVSPSGASSDEVFGSAAVQPGAVSVAPDGATSDEAFGAHVITAAGGAQGLAPAGVSSGEAFGTATLQPGAVVVDASGITTGEAFGAPVLAAVATLTPSGASSGEAFGAPAIVAAGPAQTIGLGGHAIPPRGEDASGGIRFYGINTGDVGRIAIPRDVAGVSTPVDVGAGDFTVEFWIRARYADNATSVTDVRYSNIIYDGDDWDQVYGQCIGVTRSSGTLRAIYGQADTGLTWLGIVGTTDVGDDAWHHVAVVRQYSTGTVRVYVDGVDNGSRTYTASRDLSYPDGSSVGEGQRNEYWVIGTEKHDVGEAFNGYFDELRISDIRRYTAAFTPPARRFEPDSSAVGLYHFDDGAGTTARDAATVTGAPTHGTLLVGGTPQAPQWVLSQAPLADGAKVGSPAVTAGGLALAPAGIATDEAFGTPTLQPGAVGLACSGIGSGEAVGTPAVAVGAVSVVPSGAGSDEIFGAPAITTAVAVVASGASSDESFGAPAVLPGVVVLEAASTSSAEAFGAPVVDVAGVVTLAPAGIASGEAVSAPQIVPGAVAVVAAGISGDEAFGAPVVTFGSVTVGGIGITTDEAFGTPAVLPGAVTIAASGIAPEEAFGTPVVTAPSGDVVAPSGVPTDEAFGSAAVQPGVVAISTLGVAPAEAFGTPVVAEQALTIAVVGLASDEAVGMPVIQVGAVSIAGAGIASAETFGTPLLAALLGGRVVLQPRVRSGALTPAARSGALVPQEERS